jgi:folylpolyglutamate synthase/dihydropteroate synthase
MLKSIVYEKVILTQFNNPRSYKSQDIKENCQLHDAMATSDIQAAFQIAKKLYSHEHVILIAGSFFLASEAKVLLQRKAQIW